MNPEDNFRIVDLGVGGARAKVTYAALSDLLVFFREVSGFATLASRMVTRPELTTTSTLAFIVNLSPGLASALIGLLKTCVVIEPVGSITFDQIPPWALPGLFHSWLDVNFGSPEKIGPWAQMLNPFLSDLAGKPIDIEKLMAKREQGVANG